MLPAHAAEEMAEEVGVEYGKAMAAAIDPSETHRSYQGALHAVADALSAHGFAARAERAEDDKYQIVAQNCPFGDAVVEHPVICASTEAWSRECSAIYTAQPTLPPLPQTPRRRHLRHPRYPLTEQDLLQLIPEGVASSINPHRDVPIERHR